MAVLVLLLGFLQAWLHGFLLLITKRAGYWHSIRHSFISAIVILSFSIIVINELLSLFHALSFTPLFLIWTVIVLCHGFFLYKRYNVRDVISKYAVLKLHKHEAIIFFCVVVISALTFLTAIVSPPNGWDSMTYHMARVAHWQNNSSVDHYPTHIIRQLFQPPFAEFVILQLQILSGTDAFANLVQWMAFAGCLAAASLIVELFGASRLIQLFSMLIAATLPMAILHASSTQNDLIMGFWCLSLFYYVFRITFKNENTFQNFLYVGIALGAGTLCKGTAYLYLSPAILYLLLHLLVKKRSTKIFSYLTLCLALAFFLNVFHYLRNYKVFNDPLGGTEEVRTLYANQAHSPSAISSNVIRNAALHLSTPLGKINAAANKALVLVHKKVLHIDINDPATTYVESEFEFGKYGLGFHEVSSSNFIHMCLILLCIPLFFLFRKHFNERKIITSYLTIILFGIIFFCYYLKWQESYSRLHTPVFLLLAPFLAITLSYFKPNKLLIAGLLLFVFSLPWLIMNNLRPLISHAELGPLNAQTSILLNSRDNIRFENRIEIKSDYDAVTKFIREKSIFPVALYLEDNDWDYPFWRMLGDRNLQHILVTNPSQKLYSGREELPACIVSTFHKSDTLIFKQRIYQKELETPSLKLFTLTKEL
jgi:hypothetical protein